MKARPIPALLLLATVLPELVSGSTPVISFLNPGTDIFLLLGYGLPILLLREFAVRRGSGLGGLFFLGLAYAIVNEGLLAKTFIIHQHLPVPLYDNYGYWLGISFPWAAGISVWHALASVVFPILLTHYFFPQEQDKPWLKGKVALCLSMLLGLLACMSFLGTSQKGVKGTPVQLAVLLALMLVCVVCGERMQGRMQSAPVTSVMKPLLLGFSIIVPFWGLGALAGAKPPPVVFFVALVAVILLYNRLLDKGRWLTVPAFLYFGVGWYCHNVLQALVFIGLAAHNPPLALITAIADSLALWLLLRSIAKSSRVQGDIA